MRFDGNFRLLGHVDITELRSGVERQANADWDAQQYRQKKFGVHSQTQTLFLLFDSDFRHFEPTWLPKGQQFYSALRPVIEQVSRYFGFQGWVVRCIMTRLRAGGRIAPHADSGFSLSHTHRCHLAIVTNDAVQFSVGAETINMKVGELWEINNQRDHSVYNSSSEDRVHLILDWAEPMAHEEVLAYALDRREHARKVKQGITPQYD